MVSPEMQARPICGGGAFCADPAEKTGSRVMLALDRLFLRHFGCGRGAAHGNCRYSSVCGRNAAAVLILYSGISDHIMVSLPVSGFTLEWREDGVYRGDDDGRDLYRGLYKSGRGPVFSRIYRKMIDRSGTDGIY